MLRGRATQGLHASPQGPKCPRWTLHPNFQMFTLDKSLIFLGLSLLVCEKGLMAALLRVSGPRGTQSVAAHGLQDVMHCPRPLLCGAAC